MELPNIPLGQAPTLWIEVFLCPSELPAALIRARAAGIHTIVADQARFRVVLMVRTPIRRGDDADTKRDVLSQVERTIRGTLSAIGFLKTFKDVEYEDSHQRFAGAATTRPNTDARQFELAVLSLGNQVKEADLDLLRLYLVPISIIQERGKHRAQGGSWVKSVLWRHWYSGDAGVENIIRELYETPAPPKVWRRVEGSRR